jgi:glycosyltransferase involved in cell wall biosynthesis
VSFLGFLRKAELGAARQQAMALAVPSIWYENAPLAVLEAMADGLPIIASRIGGLPELVTSGENGLLVDPQNVDAWTDALRQFVLLGPTERTRMGMASREWIVERHAWEPHLAELDALYHEAGAAG